MGGEPGAKTADAISRTHTVETSLGRERGARRLQGRVPKLRQVQSRRKVQTRGPERSWIRSPPFGGGGSRSQTRARSYHRAEVCRKEPGGSLLVP